MSELYFAYGSNMSKQAMGAIVPDHEYLGVARLDGFELAFTRRSIKTGTGVSDVVPSVGHTVWGTLYRVSPEQSEVLDREVGVGIGAYVRLSCRVELIGDTGPRLDAFTYVVADKSTDYVPPSRDYLASIVIAAKERGLPKQAIRKLKAIPTVPPPLRRRFGRYETRFERTVRNVSWRGQVESRARDLADDLEVARAQANVDRTHVAVAERNIRSAHEIAQNAPWTLLPTWFRRWSSGSDIEMAWAAIHNADAAMVMILPSSIVQARLRDLRARIATTLPESDGRREPILNVIRSIEDKPRDDLAPVDRAQISEFYRVVGEASDLAHLNIRNYRNWLLIVSSVVTLGLVGAAIAHDQTPEFLSISEAHSHISADVAQLEAAGAIGGLLMALFALIRLQVYSGPVALPLWQALVRIPAGGAAALVGTALMQGGIINAITPQSRSGLLGYAVLFGAAPELVLRFLDRRINEATAAARPTSDPLKPVPAESPAPPGTGSNEPKK